MKVSLILKGVPYDYQAEALELFIKHGKIVQVAARATDSGDDVDNDGWPDPAQFAHPIFIINDSATFTAAEMTHLIINLGA